MILVQQSVKFTFEDVVEAVSVAPDQSIPQRLAKALLNCELVSPELELAVQEAEADAQGNVKSDRVEVCEEPQRGKVAPMLKTKRLKELGLVLNELEEEAEEDHVCCVYDGLLE